MVAPRSIRWTLANPLRSRRLFSMLFSMLFCTLCATLLVGTVAWAQSFDGRWSLVDDPSTTLELHQAADGRIQGVLEASTLTVELDGQVDAIDPEAAYGWVYGQDGEQLSFEAYTDASGLVLYVIGTTPAGELDYMNATELLFTPEPAAGAPNTSAPSAKGTPAGKAGAPAQPDDVGALATDSPVIAVGPYGELTRDNADAFVDALQFSLQQAGFSGVFTAAEREQIVQAVAQNFGTLSPDEQQVLTQARFVWNRVQQNWSSASPAEQQEFVLGVFTLAFGEAYVRQQLGTSAGGGGGGGAGGCGNIDDCIGSYADPEALSDTMNAQSCWAAAGCDGYDPGSNDFTYDAPGDY